MPKRQPKPKDLVARSISITDAKGKTRIYMAADEIKGKGVYSCICLFGERDRSIEL